MYRDTMASKILASALVVLLGTFSVGFTAAVVDDYAARDVMPAGTRIGGVDVAGLSRAQAAERIRGEVTGPLLRQATVRFAEKTFQLDPKAFLTVDVEGMLDEALAPRTGAILPQRVVDRVTGAAIGADVQRRLKVDEEALAAWVDELKPQVHQPGQDATVTVTGGGLRITAAVVGRTVEASGSVPVLAKALSDGVKDIELPVAQVVPAVDDARLGKTIFVQLGLRKLTLYNGAQIEKEYRVAVGTGGYPTPTGWWKIVNKRKNPSWSNPGSAWAKGMPRTIGPGPSNPLGTRALDLNASGIRIHGTNKDYSIGTAASHGCMRMHRWDIEDLFPRVPVGTRVIIVR